MHRDPLKSVSRIVVKLGTGVLTDSRKQPDPAQLEHLVAQLAALRQAGKEVVLVTSGAVGAGMGALGYETRPANLAEKQACAAVGQSRLMAVYDKLFAAHNLVVAQVLLTHDDLEHHERHLNARNTLVTLLQRGVVPIINENDAVSFTEIKFGDNDKLSALVASLLPADLLVILTTVDGVIENFGKKNPRTLSVIEQIDTTVEDMAGGTTSETATGGMISKIAAAKLATKSGCGVFIASGAEPEILAKLLSGRGPGTFFVPSGLPLEAKKHWLAYFQRPAGTLLVNANAVPVLREQGRSLLAVGVTGTRGEFAAGDIVNLAGPDGIAFARGKVAFGSDEIPALAGQQGAAVAALYPARKRLEVIHRNDLVLL